MAIKKVTVSLPEETVESIKALAEQRGVTNSEATRQAIESEKFLREELGKNNKVLLESPDGTISRLIFR